MEWDSVLGLLVEGFVKPDDIRKLIFSYLERIPPQDCRDYICNNRDLLAPVSEKQWKLVRSAARNAGIIVSYEEVVSQLSSHNPDILAIISTTDGGIDWLQRQVDEAQKRLAP